MNRFCVCALALGLVASAGFVTAQQSQRDGGKAAPKDKAGKLEGSYTIVSGERAGTALPKADFDGATVTFTDKKVMGADKSKSEFFSALYTVDRSKSPWVISMTDAKAMGKDADKEKYQKDQGASATGLIKQDGDTVTLVYALPGGKAPTEFKAGENQQMFVLKRTDRKQD
jgi:uncharacterized protein (TIGR03067 family)